MGRAGACDLRELRARGGAATDAAALESPPAHFPRSLSLMDPATLSVRAFVVFAVSQFVGEPTEGRQENSSLPPSLARP